MKTVFSLVFAILAIAMLGVVHISFGAALTATPNPFSLSNTTIDVGQSATLSSSISGGTGGPYYGQWTWINSNEPTGQVTNTITVGSYPSGVAFNPSGTLAYVTNTHSGNVSVIDTATNTVANTITLGYSYPNSVAFNPSGTLAYVAFITASSTAETTIDVIHTSTNTVSTINLGITAFEIALNPSGTLAYVTDGEGYQVGVIDLATSTSKFININDNTEVYPQGIVLNPSGTLAYVADYNSGKVSVIDTATNTLLENISVGGEPYYIALNPSGTLAYVTEYSSNIVSVINAIPETPVQALPSNDLFGLTATALNSNTMVFTSNGIQYDQGAGTSNIYGTWSLQGFAEDSNGYYEDSSTPIDIGNTVLLSNTLTVNPALTAPTAPTVSATKLDVNQPLTVNGIIPSTGTPTYSWQWLYSTGSGYSSANSICGTGYGTGASAGASEQCSIAANTLTAGDTYTFELQVTDSASTPETQTSGASPTVAVNPALSNAAFTFQNPTTTTLYVDYGQGSSLTDFKASWTGGTPDYAVFFYFSNPNSDSCTSGSATGASGVSSSPYSVSMHSPGPSNSAYTPATYYVCSQITDSATSHETIQSSPGEMIVANALAISLSPSSNTLDANQQLPLTATVSGGTPSFTLSYTTSNSICGSLSATSNALSADGANTIVFTANSALTSSCATTITSSVKDSATSPITETASSSLTVNPVLSAGSVTPSSPTIDNGQTITLTANPSGGTTSYSYQWYSGSSSTCSSDTAISGMTAATYVANPTSSTYYCYKVTDSATTSTSAYSSTDYITVDSAPSISTQPASATIDNGQSYALSVTATGGTGSYSYQWYTGAPGSGATISGATSASYTASPTSTTEYYVIVTDTGTTSGATPAATATSSGATVTVNPAPTATSLTPSNTILDSGQYETYSVLISGGTGPFTANLIYVSGSGTVNGMTAGNVVETNTIGSDGTIAFPSFNSISTNGIYTFNVVATDSASTPVTFNSVANTITVNTALTKPNPPTVSTPYVDQGQTGTVTATIPSTGTSPYNYWWMVATPSNPSSFSYAVECATPNGADASAGATETCTFSTSSSTATGAYEYELDVADSATTSETQTSSASSALIVNPAPTATSLTPSNTVLDFGQYETYNVLITGGTGPYTANLIYVSGPPGATVNSITAGNVVETNTIGSDGTITFPSFNSFSTMGSYTFNVIATDSSSTPVAFNSLSNTITVNPAPTATSLTPSNTAINSGQYVTYNVIIDGGILPITANLVLVSNSIPIQINGANAITGTTYNTIVLDAGSTEPNTITFNSLQLNTSITSGGNVIFAVNAVDSANTPIAFNSVSNTVIINAVVVPHHSGSTGPPKYTFTLSDNINSTLASAQPVYTIYASSGNISYYQNQLPVTLSLLTPYLNVSWACNVSIGANTYTYQNDVYGLGLGIPCGKYYTAYTPNLEAIYSLSAPTKINTTTTSTTTILPTPPTPPANKSNKSITLNGSISSSSPFKINFTNMHVVVVLTSPSLVPMRASASITNETSMVLPTLANYTLISAFNISVTTAANVSSEVTSPYSCGINSSLIKPFELVNGTWTAITPFSVNATACTVSFVVPKDPIVGIFQKIVPTTTVTTTVNTTTTIAPTTTVLPPKVNTAAIAVAVIVTVIILLVLAYYYMSKAGKHRRR